MDNKAIGLRIEQRRKNLDLTLGQIASKIGVATSTVQRYEKGTIETVKKPVIVAIARVLDVNPDWLLFESDDMNRIEDKQKPPATENGSRGGLRENRYDELNEKNRRVIDDLIETLVRSQSGG